MVEEQDERILAELQKSGRATNQELADAVGMSTSACWRRVRALEESGVISGYAALVERERAGFATSAILHVSLERHDAKFVDEFVARVKRRSEVLECFATTGDADYHLRVVVRDIHAYNQFLDEFMFRVPGIRYVRTNMILKEIKTGVALPFDTRRPRKD
ncbi:Lrp/AsnC family transcriptional regulator [Bradyrhizobium sp. BRP22]|uniref:Lrp/AsnC family transcriptional regulator n=1 Tax=Bradyrhizobium sp. BRP22 TaxID=2793821 RepID=UPI001CD6D6BF|nr:Lrp/AsnC family transcriptional regulator [Bradyrhizobium sp. BRP22]MCA1457420.1 Lrp/AsnC family transcriptional regulator [Bradyrhizobium sp. BRP22]